nr:MAG TPA: hypothetical protein [Caudoviricetes sp.]
MSGSLLYSPFLSLYLCSFSSHLRALINDLFSAHSFRVSYVP